MISLKIKFLTGPLFLFSHMVLAGEYVPPPSGPYKSSVVVNTNPRQLNSSEKVYRFPSDGLFQSEQRVRPTHFDRSQRNLNTQNIMATNPVIEAPVVPPVITKPVDPAQAAVVKPTTPPMTGNFSTNPWAPPGSMPQPTANYPGYWNNQQYSYPQQNPYGYSNQNNFMNNAMNGMPSPWSAMPMQPFFSGK